MTTSDSFSPTSVCDALINIKDASPIEYLDALFAHRPDSATGSVLEPFPSPAKVTSASRVIFKHVPFALLLDRYLREYLRTDNYVLIKDVVDYCVKKSVTRDPAGVVGSIIDTVNASPARDELFILRVLGGTADGLSIAACFYDDVLGRLNASRYTALIGQFSSGRSRGFSRAEYLANRVREHASDLAGVTDTALAIAPEWAGTLDELLETARTLAEKQGAQPALSLS
jgi:hypothetical protein